MGAYTKNILRTIWGNKRRFLMLLLITALGAVFFVGIRSASPDMNITLDKYFDQQTMFDIQVIGNYGLTQSNIEQLRAIGGIKHVQPAYSCDLFAKYGDTSYLFRFHSGLSANETENLIATPLITAGRLPQGSGECAVSQRFATMTNCSLGDTLELSTGDDTLLNSYVSHDEYIITGFIESPLYLRLDFGSSGKGSGSLQAYAYLPFDEFTLKAYTEAQVFLTNPKGYSRFDERFKKMSAAIEDELQLLGDTLTAQRKRVVAGYAAREITNAENSLLTAQSKLAISEQELAESELTLIENEQELLQQHAILNEQIMAKRRELELGHAELLAGEQIISQARQALSQGLQSLRETRAQLETGLSLSGISEDALEQLKRAEAGFIAKERDLRTASADLTDKRSELLAGFDMLDAALYDGLIQLSLAEAELSGGQDELAMGYGRLQAEKNSATQKLAASQETLALARRALGVLPEAKCYVLGLDLNLGFESFRQDSERVSHIGRVFPLFFFLVASLVAFTSMVRIVEDDRASAAIMQSLGYSSGKVLIKYILFALSIGIPGTALGIIVGYRLFPMIIFDYGYRIMYLVPRVEKLLYPGLCLRVSVISLISVVVPTVLVSLTDMKQSPAALLRPKAPLPGKRIMLEGYKFIWSRMNFSAKVTARNILRYKKRFFMTIAGIAGCTAIVLTGFGLHDSIRTLAAKQFDNIYLYDLAITVAEGRSDRLAVERYLEAQNDVESFQYQRRENVDARGGAAGDLYEATLIVPDDNKRLAGFIKLAAPHTKKPVSPTDRGVIITQKLARLLLVSAGDEITLINEDDEEWVVAVEGISENYVGHYIYMSPQHYSALQGKAVVFTTLLCNTLQLSEVRQDEISENLLENKGVISLSFNSKSRSFYNDTLNALNIVVFVLIVCGALLAFVVLFCLTGINIDERKREIATLKVLGFYDKEASSYIFRENTINTAVGAIAGLGLGVLLHQYIIRTVEFDMIMFGKIIDPISYAYSIALTFLFTLIVNAAMAGDIRDINMIESLKSVE